MSQRDKMKIGIVISSNNPEPNVCGISDLLRKEGFDIWQ